MNKIVLSLLIASTSVNFLNAQDMDRQEPNITASYQTTINARIDSVWKVLAEDYGGIGKWASGVNHVIESSGEGLNAERSCDISAKGFNDTKERIILFQPENYYFEYDLYNGLPSFVKYSINKYQLKPKGNQTILIATNDMRVGGLMGATMKGFMRKNLNKVLETMGEELKYFIETGRQHPNKIIAMAKTEGKSAFVVEHELDVPVEKIWNLLVDDFPNVANSSQLSPKSEFVEGYNKVEVGAKRIMYKSKNLKKYFIDEIVLIDNERYDFTVDVVKAKGYPNTFTRLEFGATPISNNSTKLRIAFTYKTKPKFLQEMIKRSLKKDIQDYLYAIDHYLKTGEVITNDNWKSIRSNYP